MKKEVKLVANVNFEKKESVEFLLCEYEQCFEQMRHYDKAEVSLIEFALTGYVAIVSAIFALFNYLVDIPYRGVMIGGILVLTFFMGLLVLALMIRSRLYYVIIARQVNSLRNYFLNNMELDFIKYNKAYIDPNLPQGFNLWSTHTLLFTIISVLNGAAGGIGLYSFIMFFNVQGQASLAISVVTTVVLILMQLVIAALYLKSSTNRELSQK